MNSYLKNVTIPDDQIRVKSLLVNLEKMQAVRDLAQDTFFAPKAGADGENIGDGPYDLDITMQDDNCVLGITDETGRVLAPISFSLKPFRKLIQDYYLIVESYETARIEGNLSRLEAIDMGRRGVHNEGAALLKDRLAQMVEMNENTARRLFTLVCLLCAGRSLIWMKWFKMQGINIYKKGRL